MTAVAEAPKVLDWKHALEKVEKSCRSYPLRTRIAFAAETPHYFFLAIEAIVSSIIFGTLALCCLGKDVGFNNRAIRALRESVAYPLAACTCALSILAPSRAIIILSQLVGWARSGHLAYQG